jgi:hypothetical protein
MPEVSLFDFPPVGVGVEAVSRGFSSRNRPDRPGFALFPSIRLEEGGEDPASFY